MKNHASQGKLNYICRRNAEIYILIIPVSQINMLTIVLLNSEFISCSETVKKRKGILYSFYRKSVASFLLHINCSSVKIQRLLQSPEGIPEEKMTGFCVYF